MPIDGQSAWKEPGLSPEQRIDRFFNLIEHAVDNGIPLETLFSREHLKKFILFVLGESMATLTVTSRVMSPLVLGDPEYFTGRVGPKETKVFTLSEEKLSRLTPLLATLERSGWVSYTVAPLTPEKPASVKTEVVPPPAVKAEEVVTAPPPPAAIKEEVEPATDVKEETAEEKKPSFFERKKRS